MGKIASSSSKRKKKGRPSKTDLTRRRSQGIGTQQHRHRDIRSPQPPPSESDLRRSTRRRSITYIGDFYDDLDYEEDELQVEEQQHQEEEEDDDDEEEGENERRRQKKKLKLVLKLPQTTKQPSRGGRFDSLSRSRQNNVDRPASSPPSSSSYAGEEEEQEDNNNKKPFKKRKIGEDDDSDDGRLVRSSEQKKKRGGGRNGVPDSVPGTPTDSQSGIPLPDSKHLELILDKLQKKDTYGVYAVPVDPEELPDYHDVIRHPMDFGTVRKKLARGEYTNFQQFENDVFLICSNAMQYNAPETIYFKQARSIQELARKKFHRIRVEIECTAAVELKSQQTIKPDSIVKTPIRKSPCKTIQEPVGSDFSSGATLATVKDTSNFSNAMQASACERPSNIDRHIEGNENSSLIESEAEKAEEQISGKGFHSKLGKKSIVVDENRRATYNISNQPVIRAESMTTIFEGENKQLVSVGLHVDHSYARSLARFAATLGPAAWNVASRRIEQALPSGFKFGRGWVGEYEPLSTPVVMLGNLSEKQQPLNFLSKPIKDNRTSEALKVGEHESRSKCGLMTQNYEQKQPGRDSHTARARKDARKHERTMERFEVGQCVPCPNQVLLNGNRQLKQGTKDLQTVESRKGGKNAAELKASQDNVQVGHRTTNSSVAMASSQSFNHGKERHFVGPTSQRNSGLFGLAGNKLIANAIHHQQQNQSTVDFMRSENTISRNLELSCSSTTGNPMRKELDHSSEMASSKLLETVSRNKKFVEPEANGVTQGGLPNGKAVSSDSTNRQPSSFSYNFVASPQARPVTYFPGNHEQGLSDPVQMMRMLAEKTQDQQKSPNIPTSGKQITPSDPSSRRDDSSAAATAAARAWMTLGAGQSKPTDTSGPSKMHITAASLYNSTREVSQIVPQYCEEASVSGRQLQSESRFPPQVFLPQSAHFSNEPHLQNYRPVVVPQLVMSDLSRFQMQPPWRGLVPHTQPSKKPDTLPPDLNVSFQSSGSPVMSSGITSDSQQPDLALQL